MGRKRGESKKRKSNKKNRSTQNTMLQQLEAELSNLKDKIKEKEKRRNDSANRATPSQTKSTQTSDPSGYTATANIELRATGKHTITPPPPKKSALDKGPNSEARAVAQLRTNHWLSGVYLKRIKKRSHDGCWFCEPSHNSQDTPRMTRTHVLLRCVAFEEFRRETWTNPLTGEFTRPSSIGQLLGNPRWEKRLLKFLQRTKIGRIGPDLIDDEIRRVTRYEGWTDLVPDERSIDRGEQVADHILDTIVVRQT
jgi:hypothetical protein